MLKFGAIGAGMISQSGYDGLTASKAAEVVAIADLHEGRAKDYADRNKVGRVYTDPKAIIGDKSIDAVYIALPNAFHVPMSVAALEAGKHVILDKPFALDLADARKVEQAAKKSKKLFMLGMNQRFAEGPQRIKALVGKGYFGEIYAASAFWRRRAGIPRLGTWFVNKARSGGGCMLDIGVHMLDLTLYTLGNFDVESVSGTVFTKFGNRGLGEGGWGISDRENLTFDVDDFATALIRIKGGIVMNLNISWAAHQKAGDTHNVEIHGTQAGASLYPGEIFSYDATAKAVFDISHPAVDIKYPHCDRFVNFVRAILGEEEPCVTMDQALAVQKTLDAVYQSAKEGREVRLLKKFPVAVQLYSVRDALEKDFFGVLQQVKDMGYAGVEFAGYYGHGVAEIKKELKKIGLTAVSAHVALAAMAEDTPGTIAFHKELGVKYVAVPYLEEDSRPGTPKWPQVVATIRKIAEAFQKSGIQLLYHNHDFEFVKIGGEYALDALYKAIPMPLLATQLDTCWIRVAGVDPAAYLRKYSGRSPVVHLKDFTSGKGAAGKPLYALIDKEGKDGTVDVIDKSAFDFRPLGMGQQDMPAILKACEDAGTEWVVVEQDRSSDRPSMEAIKLSREYLRTLGL